MASKYGNLTLISSTSCFTIIITAIAAPIMLGEKFRCQVDGVSVTLISVGCTLAIRQNPDPAEIKEIITEANVYDVIEEKFTHLRAMVFYSVIIAIICLRICLYHNLMTKLKELGSAVQMNRQDNDNESI